VTFWLLLGWTAVLGPACYWAGANPEKARARAAAAAAWVGALFKSKPPAPPT
jgi:hypothetical protein